ncbi:hypothetical protein [Haloarcula litorea]|uniref:hypothetical protein n=1 Tax=Haloarcula litorea TaxID=3032579 RepID=UPI0023E8D171|nr:hypothetical protein [Halomicroarcula sp. GDY20]
MRRAALIAVLLVTAGCLGSPSGEPATTAEPTPTDTPTRTPAAMSNATAADRAIDAEKARVRDALADREHLSDLSFGILRPAEAAVTDRNATGAFVDATVGYSVSFDGECSLDGAATKTRYFVAPNRTALLSVEQDVTEQRRC